MIDLAVLLPHLIRLAAFLPTGILPFESSIAVVQWDYELNEAYIAVPERPELRLTPLRRGDEEGLVRLGNDPEIARWADNSPYP